MRPVKRRKIENLVDFTRDLKGVRFAENFVSVSNPRSSVTDLRFLIIVLFIYSFFKIVILPKTHAKEHRGLKHM